MAERITMHYSGRTIDSRTSRKVVLGGPGERSSPKSDSQVASEAERRVKFESGQFLSNFGRVRPKLVN